MNRDKNQTIETLSTRGKEVFRLLVESYLDTGDPVGSRTLTRNFVENISAATIRNVMQDLEYHGLLNSPHASSGRIPTQDGLRLFIDGMLEVSDLTTIERQEIDASICQENDISTVIERASSVLSSLTQTASVVMAPKYEAPIKHIEFVSLSSDRALVVLVTEDGNVENRMFTPPIGQTASAMREAANFLNAIMQGHTINELKVLVAKHIKKHQYELDNLSKKLIEKGVAVWSKDSDLTARLIVRGRSNLLDDSKSQEDLERIKSLFDDMERKKEIAQFLDLANDAEGIQIFIGSENKLFSLSGSSLVISPYINSDRKVIGAVGVIGPTRLNYGRVVPIVDYTAQLIGRLFRT